MKLIRSIVLTLFTLSISFTAQAEKGMKPFVLASKSAGDKALIIVETQGKLSKAGFELVGEYSPYANVTIIAFTNDLLKSAAAASEYGAYAAGQRVSVTEKNGEVQVSYTNPAYLAQAYRLDQDLNDVRQQLATALGDLGEFGLEEAMTAKKLRKYHYMFSMPYVDDPDFLARYKSYEDAVSPVNKGLDANKVGVSMVYSITLPGNKTLFGVALTEGSASDKFVMSEIDFKELSSSAHLPYEILVDGKKSML